MRLLTKDNRYDYWSDKTATNISFRTQTNLTVNAFSNLPGFTSVGNVNIKITKKERVTFMPPHSFLKLSLSPIAQYYPFVDRKHTDFEEHKEALNENPKVQTTIYSKKYQRDSSTIIFRNFLTFSFKEDFSTEFYADNEFYVNEIIEMDANHFSYNVLNKNKDVVRVYPYQNDVDFYKVAP